MISLADSEIKDILPLNLAEQPEVQAISYAIKLSQKGSWKRCRSQ